MPKKRSAAQAIGEQAEAIFRREALAAGMLPNKFENDYGIDFICQVVTAGSDELQEVEPALVSVSVKGREKTTPKIRLALSDLETAVECSTPFAFVVVCLPSSELYFRILDVALLNEFTKVIRKGKSSHTLTRQHFMPFRQFRNVLIEALEPKTRSDLLLHREKYKLSIAVGTHYLGLHQTDGSSRVFLGLTDISGLFGPRKEDREQAMEFLLTRPNISPQDFQSPPGLPALTRRLKRLGEQVDIIAPLGIQNACELGIHDANGAHLIDVGFEARWFERRLSLVHPCGVAILFTFPQGSSPDLAAGKIECYVGAGGSKPFFAEPTFLDWLRACRFGTSLCFDHHCSEAAPLEGFRQLRILGSVARGLSSVYEKLGVTSPKVTIDDIVSDRYADSIQLVSDIVDALDTEFLDVVPTVTQQEDGGQYEWQAGAFGLPILLELPDCLCVMWGVFLGAGQYLLEEKVRRLVGCRLYRTLDYMVYRIAGFRKAVELPQIVWQQGRSIHRRGDTIRFVPTVKKQDIIF